MKKNIVLSASIIFGGLLNTAQATTIFSEDFEDGMLDPRISIQTVGSFSSAPGIQDVTVFGSTQAFGFGRSTCPFNCFFNFVTTFEITLSEPQFISTLSFKEIELFENFGSDGSIFIDGIPITDGFRDFGRLPFNDRQPDTTFRERIFSINQNATTITLRVADITNLSEIFIDDVTLDVNDTPIPEPATFTLLVSGLFGIGFLAHRRRLTSLK